MKISALSIIIISKINNYLAKKLYLIICGMVNSYCF